MVRSRINVAFGEVLRDLRQQAGISQEQLAYRSGLHRTYVSQLERGLKSPSLAAIESLAEALDDRPHALIKAAENRAGALGEVGDHDHSDNEG